MTTEPQDLSMKNKLEKTLEENKKYLLANAYITDDMSDREVFLRIAALLMKEINDLEYDCHNECL